MLDEAHLMFLNYQNLTNERRRHSK